MFVSLQIEVVMQDDRRSSVAEDAFYSDEIEDDYRDGTLILSDSGYLFVCDVCFYGCTRIFKIGS